MIAGDGTFTKGKDFKHVVLLAVTFDAENKIVVLAAALVPVENAENWTWFHRNLKQDFPGFTAFMADADKGIRSEEFRASQSQDQGGTDDSSRCTLHLSANCREANKGPMNHEQRKKIFRLAHSCTMPTHH